MKSFSHFMFVFRGRGPQSLSVADATNRSSLADPRGLKETANITSPLTQRERPLNAYHFLTGPRWLIGSVALIVFMALWPPSVWAHIEGDPAGGFLSGLGHPISGLDHVLAMIAVGIWGAQLGAPAVWVLPVAFPMVMAFGGMVGLMGLKLPGVELGIAVSAIALGAMVLVEARPPLWLAALVVGFFAIFHGHAHGTELPQGASGLMYSIGFVIATGCLHGAGITIGLIHRWPAGQAVLRVGGAIVALAGGFFLWKAVG